MTATVWISQQSQAVAKQSVLIAGVIGNSSCALTSRAESDRSKIGQLERGRN